MLLINDREVRVCAACLSLSPPTTVEITADAYILKPTIVFTVTSWLKTQFSLPLHRSN
jgi:hypothetical protein